MFKKNKTTCKVLACEQQTHFRSSLLSLRKCVCCSQASKVFACFVFFFTKLRKSPGHVKQANCTKIQSWRKTFVVSKMVRKKTWPSWWGFLDWGKNLGGHYCIVGWWPCWREGSIKWNLRTVSRDKKDWPSWKRTETLRKWLLVKV